MQNITNIRIVPSNDTIKQITLLVDSVGLPHADFDAHPHCTIIYSPDFIDAKTIKLPTLKMPIIAKNAKLEIFNTKDDGYVLVLSFNCEYAKQCFDYVKEKYNVTTKYNEYKAHITLQKNINKNYTSLPEIKFDLIFDKLLVTNSD